MANLNGQNIGTNYKGIINIGSTINQNISASLQSLTDGDGNNLPIQVATGLVSIDGGTINLTTGTNTRSVLSHSYTINTTGGTNTIRGIFLNAIETSITGTTHNLMDLQVGGTSAFRVGRTGALVIGNASTVTALLAVRGTGNLASFETNAGVNRFILDTNGNISNVSALSMNGNLLFGDTQIIRIAHSTASGVGGIILNHSSNGFGAPYFYLGATANAGNFFEFQNSFGGTALMRIYQQGNVAIGHTATTTGRLHVRGAGGNIAVFETSAGTSVVSISTTGLLTAAAGIAVEFGAGISFTGTTGSISVSSGILYQTAMNGGYQAGHVFRGLSNASYNNTSGDAYNAQFTMGFNPTSGTGRYAAILLSHTINQTGGANGITRGIFINPTLTSAPDFRAIDVQTGTTSAHKLIRLADAAGVRILEVTAASEIGFYGAAPVTRPTVTGQRANPEDALSNLLTALANLGLITNSTNP
jgi:hypothetical protein